MIMITLPISVNVPYAHVGWIRKTHFCHSIRDMNYRQMRECAFYEIQPLYQMDWIWK